MPQVRKIIVSDNDQIFLASCQNAFALRGMQTVPVPKHGRLLWDAIEKERPALVVCNIFMAYCDAIHIMEQLNQNMETVPVFVALCASDNECLFERFLSAGGADIFVKPFDADILAERIVQHLEQADRKNNLRRVDFSPFSPSPADDAAKLLKTIGRAGPFDRLPLHQNGADSAAGKSGTFFLWYQGAVSGYRATDTQQLPPGGEEHPHCRRSCV